MVIDANVLAALFLERRPHVRYALAEEEWSAPRIWRSEFISTLRKYVKAGLLPVEGAAAAHVEAEAQLRLCPDPEPLHVLKLSLKSGCSTYDCEYVAAAQATGEPLMTFDKDILNAFPAIARRP